MKRPALFLDRDGVLIQEKHYLKDPAGVEIMPGAAEVLRLAQNKGMAIIVISNQSGVARGKMTAEDVEACNARMVELLKNEEVIIDSIHWAGGLEEDSRRKPSPSMIFEARDKLDLDLTASIGVGDRLTDIECWKNAGIGTSVLVLTGYGKENVDKVPEGVLVVDSLAVLAEVLLAP